MYPWTKGMKNVEEAKIQDAMKKWTAMGPVAFQSMPSPSSPLQSKAKQMQAPDEFKAKLKERARKNR